MKIVFMGTPHFAAESLSRLYCENRDVVGVFTQPDRPRSRGMKVCCSPVKELALAHSTPVFQPASLREGEVISILRELNCDLIAVVAYGRLLPEELLNLPPLGCVNIHASLLPKYRGAAPIQWAILNGEQETGVTSIFMSNQLDAGDILLMKKTCIDSEETSGSLMGRLSIEGAFLLSQTIDAIVLGKAVRMPQAHNEATYAPPLDKSLSPIDWSESAYSIKCKVRALNPWPTATMEWGEKTLKVFSVEIDNCNTGAMPGQIISAGKGGLRIACLDGSVAVKQLQAPGCRVMDAEDFLRGQC